MAQKLKLTISEINWQFERLRKALYLSEDRPLGIDINNFYLLNVCNGVSVFRVVGTNKQIEVLGDGRLTNR